MKNVLSNIIIILQNFCDFVDQRLGIILYETFWFLQCEKPHFKVVSANSLKEEKMTGKNNEHIHVLGFIRSPFKPYGLFELHFLVFFG